MSPVEPAEYNSYDIRSPNPSFTSTACLSPPLSVCSSNSRSQHDQPPSKFGNHYQPTARAIKKPNILGPMRLAPPAYESLKSHLSTCSSQGSTGSKMTVSDASSAMASPDLKEVDEYLDENPDMIKNLSFVSPKSGVYRPMPDSRKRHQNCIVM